MRTTRKRARRAARRLYRACLVNGRLDDSRVRRIARTIAGSRQRGALPILSAFRRRVWLDRRQHTALIETAVPLAADLQQDVDASLVRLYGPELTRVFEHRPALIGGMRITVGSDVYDGSVQRALFALEERFTE